MTVSLSQMRLLSLHALTLTYKVLLISVENGHEVDCDSSNYCLIYCKNLTNIADLLLPKLSPSFKLHKIFAL